jgi:hypothetical protein
VRSRLHRGTGPKSALPLREGRTESRQTWWYMTDVKALNANLMYSRVTLSIRPHLLSGCGGPSTLIAQGQLPVKLGASPSAEKRESTMILGAVVSSGPSPNPLARGRTPSSLWGKETRWWAESRGGDSDRRRSFPAEPGSDRRRPGSPRLRHGCAQDRREDGIRSSTRWFCIQASRAQKLRFGA